MSRVAGNGAGKSVAAQIALRMVAVFVLVAGVVGGIYAGTNRAPAPTQQIEAAPDFRPVDDERLIREQMRTSRDRASHRQADADARSRAREKADDANRRAADRAKAADSAADGDAPPPDIGPIPVSCNEYTGNRQIGCALMLQAGYPIDQMPCLEKLWTKESGWNHRSENRSSGAYGIPQALPGSKMAKYGDDWRTNPATQIKWGLDYIKGRYKTPCGAWTFFRNNGWY